MINDKENGIGRLHLQQATPSEHKNDPYTHLVALYGQQDAIETWNRLQRIIQKYQALIPEKETKPLSEKDALLITYGDQVIEPNLPPLQSLVNFCQDWVQGIVSGLHLLPFFPYSSDDGFSVIDYKQVNPEWGKWSHIEQLNQNFRLMFDLVINHISARSDWFQGFVRGEEHFQDYFIVIEGDPDLSQVVRPRALPLLTDIPTTGGIKRVWTTFSTDQIDLNYQNPRVLLEMLDVLLFYVSHGADFIRLDAIAYLWKQIGTPCIHLPQTHRVIQLIRSVLDLLAPDVKLITETNVPHHENIAYFGNGTNEAQLAYNFALPPLILHTFRTGDAWALSEWASNLALPSPKNTFFNFLSSHDGIGVTPARSLIPDEEINRLVEMALQHGGQVSYRNNPDGSQSPYELNINFFDALSSPDDDNLDLQIDRFISAHAILFALRGLPGIYFHSLFGSRSWQEGISLTGQKRAINRQKLARQSLETELGDPESLRARVFFKMTHLLKIRGGQPAFNPYGNQHVINFDHRLFALIRNNPAGDQMILCLHNISSQMVKIDIELGNLAEQFFNDELRSEIFQSASSRSSSNSPLHSQEWINLIDNKILSLGDSQSITFDPYQILWLKPKDQR